MHPLIPLDIAPRNFDGRVRFFPFREVRRPSAVAATALRWNGGEFLNIFPGKTPLRTFVCANILVEVWAIPALGIRAPFLRGARCHVEFVETRAERKEDAFRQRPDREDIGFLPRDELRLPGADSCAGPVREFSNLTI